MKKIEFKTVSYDYPIFGKGKIIYKEQIEALLLTPADPQLGTTAAEMREVTEIYLKVYRSQGFALLEDWEHKIISDRFENAVFKFNCPEIITMIRDVQDAEDVSLGEVKAN